MLTLVQLCRWAYIGMTLTEEQIRLLYGRLIALMIVAVAVILLGWQLNLHGHREACIIMSLALGFMFAVVSFDPIRLVLVAGAGAVAGRLGGTGVRSTAAKFFQVYVKILGDVLLWGMLLLFILGNVPFGERPEVIWSLTAGTILLALMDWRWQLSAKISKKLLFSFVVGTMVVNGLMLISSPVYVKYLGWDPATMAPTQADDALYDLNKDVRNYKAAAKKSAVDPLHEKFVNGTATPADLAKAEELLRAQSGEKSRPSNVAACTPYSTVPVQPMSDEAQTLVTPAYADSQQVPVGPGQHIEMTGYGYVLQNVFETFCEGPRVVKAYLKNKTSETIYTRYVIRAD